MPTIAERENLLPSVHPHQPSFSATSSSRDLRRQRSVLDIDCRHVLRGSVGEMAHGRPTVEYRLWLEAGKLNSSTERTDNPVIVPNSRTWRNFRRQYGEFMSDKQQPIRTASGEGRSNRSPTSPPQPLQQQQQQQHHDKPTITRRPQQQQQQQQPVSESIASLYPIRIPQPSHVGNFTYAKFLSESPVIKNPKLRSSVLKQVQKDIAEFKRLRLRSELRDPPLTDSGAIIPPDSFRFYPPHHIPTEQIEEDQSERADSPLAPGEQLDMFGRRVRRARPAGALPWKLEYKLNNPEYDKVKSMLATGVGQTQTTNDIESPPVLNKHTLVLISA